MSFHRRFLIGIALAGLSLLLLGQAGCREKGDAETASVVAARSAFIDGEYLRAEESYEKYLQANPKGKYRLEAWERLADISQYVRNAPAKTAKLLESSLLEYGGDPETASLLLLRAARMRSALKEYDKAGSLYAKLLENDALPQALRVDIVLEYAHSRLEAHDDAGALALLQQTATTSLTPELKAKVTLELGLLQLRLGNKHRAETLLREVYDYDAYPQALRARAGFALAALLQEKRETEAAMKILESLRPLYPNPQAIEQQLKVLQSNSK